MIATEHVSELLTDNEHPEVLVEIFNRVLPRYEISTRNRVAGFLAQCGHESGDFTDLEENLNYGAERLHEVFRKHFPTVQSARAYEHDPEKIANRIYGGRYGNGPESSGDGYKFRGRGAIQLTFRANYQEFAEAIGITVDDAAPFCATLEGAVESACWFWRKRGLNAVCDDDDIVRMTRIINGGINGLPDRRERYEKAKKLLPAVLFE